VRVESCTATFNRRTPPTEDHSSHLRARRSPIPALHDAYGVGSRACDDDDRHAFVGVRSSKSASETWKCVSEFQ
jgi:hypothetical protein